MKALVDRHAYLNFLQESEKLAKQIYAENTAYPVRMVVFKVDRYDEAGITRYSHLQLMAASSSAGAAIAVDPDEDVKKKDEFCQVLKFEKPDVPTISQASSGHQVEVDDYRWKALPSDYRLHGVLPVDSSFFILVPLANGQPSTPVIYERGLGTSLYTVMLDQFLGALPIASGRAAPRPASAAKNDALAKYLDTMRSRDPFANYDAMRGIVETMKQAETTRWRTPEFRPYEPPIPRREPSRKTIYPTTAATRRRSR